MREAKTSEVDPDIDVEQILDCKLVHRIRH